MKSAIAKTGLRYGLVAAVMLTLLYGAALLFGTSPILLLDFKLSTVQLGTVFVLPTFVALSIAEFRKWRNGGILHFWQGMSVGFWVWGIGTIASLLFVGIYLSVQDQALADYIQAGLDHMESYKEVAIKEGGIEQYEANRKLMQQSSIATVLADDAIKKIGLGVIVASVTSIILRKKEANAS